MMGQLLNKEDTVLNYAQENEKSQGPDRMRTVARGYLLYGDHKRSERILKKLLENNPRFLRAANNLALLYIDTAQLTEAEKYAKYYLSGDKDWPGVYYVLSMSNFYRGEIKKSWKYLKKGHSLTDAHSEYRNFYLEAQLHVYDRDFDAAEEDFSSEIEYRFAVEIYHNRALNHKFSRFFIDMNKQGSIPESDALLDEAERLYEAKDFEKSAMYYMFLAMLDPSEPDNYFWIGLCMELEGNVYEALRYYSLHLYSDPESEVKEDIRDFFQSREVGE